MKTEETTLTATVTSKPKPEAKAAKAKKAAKPATKKASKAIAGKKLATKATSTKPASSTAKKEARQDTKKAIVLGLLRRKQGATTAEIAKATDWQNHSIRGFLSGHVTKKMGLTVESSKSKAGERTYRIAK